MPKISFLRQQQKRKRQRTMKKQTNNYLELRRNASKYANFGGVDNQNESPLLQRGSGNFYGQFANMHGNGGVQQVQGTIVSKYVKILNTDPNNDLVLDLFQANRGIEEAFDGLADSAGTISGAGVGLVIKVGNESHREAKNRSIHKPFLIEGLRAQFPSDAQLAQEWELITRDNNRRLTEDYFPSAHLTAGQQQSRQVDHGGFNMLVNGDSGFRWVVLRAPSASVPNIITVTFNVRAITDSAELLRGQSPLGINPGQSLGGADLY